MTQPDRLREAAQRVINGAETDDDFDGAFVEYLVPAADIDELRAALAAPAPDLLAAVVDLSRTLDWLDEHYHRAFVEMPKDRLRAVENVGLALLRAAPSREAGLTGLQKQRLAAAALQPNAPASREADEDERANIAQAGMGGPDFTPKEWAASREAGLDEERLAQALHVGLIEVIPEQRGISVGYFEDEHLRRLAEAIAAEYARLSTGDSDA